MNAPATLTQVRPDANPVRAGELISLELIRKLVSFDTTSRGSNLALIDWVRAYLGKYGIVSAEFKKYRVDYTEPVYDPTGKPRGDFFTRTA